MKKYIYIILFINCLYNNIIIAQGNKSFTENDLVGTWNAKNLETGDAFQFSLFANHKAETNTRNGISKTNWYLEGGDCVFYDEYDKLLYYSVITYFDGKNIKYRTSLGGRYSAERTSKSPKKTQSQNANNNKKGNSNHYICVGCINTGETTCTTCYGRGGGVSIGYCTVLSCGNGKRLCEYCYQRACTSEEMLFTTKVNTPNTSMLYGKWKCSNGDTYEFLNSTLGKSYDVGTQTLVIYSNGEKFLASWIIEDNLLKIRVLSFYNSHFVKYWFKSGWSNKRIQLESLDDFKTITFSR